MPLAKVFAFARMAELDLVRDLVAFSSQHEHIGSSSSVRPWTYREGTHLRKQVRELSEHGKVEP
jgi:hypothetical protein